MITSLIAFSYNRDSTPTPLAQSLLCTPHLGRAPTVDGIADELARGDDDGKQSEQKNCPHMIQAVDPIVITGSLKFLQRRNAADY